jgi:DNA invertase Pin-like site-specific DNA recombinase
MDLKGEGYMKLAYIRVSSKDQNEQRQLDSVIQYGVHPDNIYLDKQSGANFNREQYSLMLKVLREGDILVIKSIDRLGRDYTGIKEQWQKITSKGAHIHVLDMPMLNTDQKLITGLESKIITDIVLSLLGYIAEAERERIKTRQAEGIQSAKRKGKHLGRPALNVKPELLANTISSVHNKFMTVDQACKVLDCSRRSFYRLRTEYKAALPKQQEG